MGFTPKEAQKNQKKITYFPVLNLMILMEVQEITLKNQNILVLNYILLEEKLICNNVLKLPESFEKRLLKIKSQYMIGNSQRLKKYYNKNYIEYIFLGMEIDITNFIESKQLLSYIIIANVKIRKLNFEQLSY